MINKTDTVRTLSGTAKYITSEIYQNLSYSLTYDMIVLKTPLYHPTEFEIRNRVINRDFEYPNDISSDLQSILHSLLTKNPLKRFGISELQSSDFYSSPYSLEEIERENVNCPWQKTVWNFCL